MRSAPTSITLIGAMTLLLAGCSIATPRIVPTEAAVSTAGPVDQAANTQRLHLRDGCNAFQEAMDTFSDASRVAAEAQSVEQYAAALEDLAFELGDQALEVGDTGEVELDLLLAHLASETAAFADEYLATGEATASRWLTFRTGVKAVGDPCNQTHNFSD